MCCFIGLMATVCTSQAQVRLQDKATSVVDLGFGVQQSELLTTAAATTITAEELQQTSAISLADALYGKLLGLTALNNGGFAGDEGKGAWLTIRGNQTLTENNILVLVDGYERPIDRLTVEEVESVTVLKDAAAVAMLGHEGVNGAILVKTKRGYNGKTHIKVGYSHKFTFDPEFAKMMDAYGYASALNQAHLNDGLTPAYTQQELDLFKDGSDPYFYPNVDWRNEAFKNSGSEDRANISVFGGTDKMKYYTMIDYTDTRGLLNGTKQQDYNSQLRMSKANLRANVDFSLTSTTNVSVNVFSMFLETKRPNDIDADGATWYLYKTPASAFPLMTSTGIWGGNETYGDGNVVAKIQDSGFQKTHQRQLWANARLNQDLSFWVKGLSFFMEAGYDNSSITIEQRYKGHQYGYEYYTGEIGDKNHVATVIQGNKEAKLTFNHWVDTQWRIAQSAVGFNYKTSFTDNDHFAATVALTNKSEVRDGRGNTFNRTNWEGHFHYDLNEKYLADLTLAANGSNRSYPSKWSFSPTLALGYILANNPDASVLNYGKIRLSGGIQHYDYAPVAGMWLSSWDSSHGDFRYGLGFSQSWGAFIDAFPTTDFSQETANKVNLGTDWRLFNALDLTADVFYQKRTHILLNARAKNSSVVGIQSAYDDVGAVKSYGFELGGRFAKEVAKDLFFNASAMVTWNRSKISAYIESPAFPNLSVIGSRVNEAWGLEALGFFADQNDIDASNRQEFSQVKPGDIKYKDQNGDNVINEFDRVALGKNIDLPALNYAFSLGLEYKGFGLNATFQGTGDYMKNLRWVDGAWGVISDNRNLSQDYYNNCWDVAGDRALYPRLTSLSVPNNEQESDIWFKSVHFFKLRDCELYYKLPQAFIQKARLQSAKIFVQGQNLLSSDNIEAMDAEVLNTNYPLLKAVNIGLQFTF